MGISKNRGRIKIINVKAFGNSKIIYKY